MPTSEEILAGVAAIVREGWPVAIAWHIALALVLVMLLRGWRPSRRLAQSLLALPLVSVSAFAFAFGNPFNGTLFALAAGALVVLARGRDEVVRATAWQWWMGIALLVYGWLYPHFLDGNPLAYLYAAPVGLIPCPTLSIVIALALLGGLARRAWGGVAAALGLFYGAFGIVRLGVVLDVGLLAGACALTVSWLASLSDRPPCSYAPSSRASPRS